MQLDMLNLVCRQIISNNNNSGTDLRFSEHLCAFRAETGILILQPINMPQTIAERNDNNNYYYMRAATGWTVRGSNPGRDEIFRTRPEWPWGSPSLLFHGYRVSSGG